MSWNIAFLPYGPRWRTWRRAFHDHFHPNASRQYQPRELKAARQLLENLLCTPERYGDHLRLSAIRLFFLSMVDRQPHVMLQYVREGDHGYRVRNRNRIAR
jgi:hypothetical protein